MASLLGITRVIPQPVDDINYIDLRLTGDEADTLYDILCVVGGDPSKSRRRYAATLFETLRKVFPGRDCQTGIDVDGHIYFKEEPL